MSPADDLLDLYCICGMQRNSPTQPLLDICVCLHKSSCAFRRPGIACYKDLGLSGPFGCSSRGCLMSTPKPLSRLPSSVLALHKPPLPSALASLSDPAATAATVLPRPLEEGPAKVVFNFIRSLSLGGRFFTIKAAFTCHHKQLSEGQSES